MPAMLFGSPTKSIAGMARSYKGGDAFGIAEQEHRGHGPLLQRRGCSGGHRAGASRAWPAPTEAGMLLGPPSGSIAGMARSCRGRRGQLKS